MDPRRAAKLADVLLETQSALISVAVRTLDDGPLDVSVVQQRILTLLWQHGELTVTAIGNVLGVDQSNASRHCTRLAQIGAVTRARSSDDGRATAVSLTRMGRRQVDAIRRARRDAILDILAEVSDPGSRAATALLEKFNRRAASPPNGDEWSDDVLPHIS